jgi:hypothetical protein
MGLFQTDGRASRLGGSKREGSTGDVAEPQRAHELQSWQPWAAKRIAGTLGGSLASMPV